MKFLDLFSKQAPGAIKHVRPSTTQTVAQREATARKIDAIESEISAEISGHLGADIGDEISNEQSNLQHDFDEPLATSRIEQAISEASILCANHQVTSVVSLLLDALRQPSHEAAEAVAWYMLLELASFDGDQARFEGLALRYAERFETSPPQWRAHSGDDASAPAASPMLAFRGKLLGTTAPALTQLKQAAATLSAFSLDLRNLTEIDVAGCGDLLHLLPAWCQAGKGIRLIHSNALLDMLRATTQQGRRDDDDAAWRLLIELLRVSGDEVGYEDACVAYCITYEQSLPTPLGLVSHAMPVTSQFLLPAQVRHPVDQLLDVLRADAEHIDRIIINCQQLRLIEFNAAAPLLAGVAALARGKPVEWRDMPYLTSTLLQLMSGHGKLNISHRRP